MSNVGDRRRAQNQFARLASLLEATEVVAPLRIHAAASRRSSVVNAEPCGYSHAPIAGTIRVDFPML